MWSGGSVWRADMPVFRMCKDPPPWEAERTSSRPVHARLAKRVAEKAARKLEQQVVTWLCLCRCHLVGITQRRHLTNCRKNSRRQWLTIIASPFFTSAIGAMQGPDLDIDTLWWMVQWGNEYLARFKQNANPARKQAHARYKTWTSNTRQKQMAGFTASLRARTGDDSFDQE